MNPTPKVVSIIIGLILAISAPAQTPEEMMDYRDAQREMEQAQRLIREGHGLANTPDMQGLDRVNDNSLIRKNGRERIRSGEALARAVRPRIDRFIKRQENLRLLMSTPQRVVELENIEGKKGIFGLESIALPTLTAVSPDLRVHNLPLSSLSEASQTRIRELAEPKVTFSCETNYGGHFFPIAHLAHPQISDTPAQKDDRELPAFALKTTIMPRSVNLAPKATFIITVRADNDARPFQQQSFDLEISAESPTQVELPIRFNPAILGARETGLGKLHVTINYGETSSYETRLDIFKHALNDLPLFIKEADGKILDTKRLGACFVNETLPEFEIIKKRALELQLVKSFGGKSRDIESVKAGMFSIWYYLSERGVNYGNTTETGLAGKHSASQQARFPSETLSARQANCIDGTILLASFALNIGLDPILIVRPGHMYLAIRAAAKKHLFIETTLLGSGDIEPEWPDMEKIKSARATFEKAQQIAQQNPQFDASALDHSTTLSRYHPIGTHWEMLNRQYQFIDIRKMRAAGILRVIPEIE